MATPANRSFGRLESGFSLSPRAYRRVTLVTVFFVAAIIVTGAAVRLSGSGMGCPTWPNCSSDHLIRIGARNYHQDVEQVNRMFTGAVSIAIVASVLGALRRVPRRRDLTWWSLSLVAGIIGQIVLGGITVLVHLNPAAVMSHLLLSMLLLAAAVILHHRAGMPDGTERRVAVENPVLWLGRTLLVMCALVVVAGTVVTGSGPHAGAADVRRWNFVLSDVARVHGTLVMLFLGLVLLTGWALYRAGELERRHRAVTVLLGVLVAQAAVGYTQYFTGVPAWLVGIHVAGAATVWVATIAFYLGLSENVPVRASAPIVRAQPRVSAKPIVTAT